MGNSEQRRYSISECEDGHEVKVTFNAIAEIYDAIDDLETMISAQNLLITVKSLRSLCLTQDG